MKLIYEQKTIETVMSLLNQLPITGINNAKSIALIAQELQQYEIVEDNKDIKTESE